MNDLVVNQHKPQDLPHGWAETTLGEIAEVRLGRQRSPKNHSGARMRPYLRAANVTWSGLDLSDVNEMNFTASESEVYELAPGDVLVAEASGSVSEVGKPAIWRGEIAECCFQNTLVRVRTRNASPDYLRYFLLSEARSGRIGDAAPGVGIHHIGSTRLSAWPVPLPPLNEQRRIVAAIEEHLSRLDAADASLVLGMERLARMPRLILAAALSDVRDHARLADVAKVRLGRQRSPKNHVGPRMRPYLRAGNVTWSGLDLSDVKEMNFTETESAIYELADGDVLLAEASGSAGEVGKPAVWRGEIDQCCFQNTLIRVRAPGEDPDYLRAVFLADALAGKFAQAAPGVGIHHLGSTRLSNWIIPLPPLGEQRRIVARVEEQLSAIDALRATIERAQRRSAQLRRAILERAFRGELVPQDPSDEPASVLLGRLVANQVASSPDTGGRRRALRN